MKFQGLKPIYNRTTRTYEVHHLPDADPQHTHQGYYVFDSYAGALGMIFAGTQLQSWKSEHRQAVAAWLIRKMNEDHWTQYIGRIGCL